MTVKMIDEIFVYTSTTENVVESQELIAWFDHSDIPYSLLKYSDIEQCQIVLDAVNTWWQPDENDITQEPLTSYPFVIYTEVHSDKPLSYLPRKYIQGKDNIIAELPTLYALGR